LSTPSSARSVRAASTGDGSMAARLFEVYKDQMASDQGLDDSGTDDSGTDEPRAIARASAGRPRRATRSKRVPRQTSYSSGLQEKEEKREKYFFRVEDGSLRPRTGVHGGGEPQWWALRVTVGREKQTCTNIERRYQQLREAAVAEGTDDGMQEIETWDVWKRVRAWNPKTEKMGNKMVRYDGGGWVMLRAVMDTQIAGIIKGNINILGFHHREVFEGEEFPIPADGDLVDALASWQASLEDISEDEVRATLGLGPKRDVDDFMDFQELEDDVARDGRRGAQREGRRSGGRSLFSGQSQSSDDTWGDDASSWYDGASSEDEGLIVDGEFEGTFGATAGEDAMGEFGTWLGDFSGDASGDDGWNVGVIEREASLPATSTSDDLSWWDDDGKGGEEASSDAVDVDPSGSRAVSIVRGEFKDFEGVLLEGGDEGEEAGVRVEVDVFGLPTVVELAREDVEFLDGR
jgi:transcription antitermination factor NusG